MWRGVTHCGLPQERIVGEEGVEKAREACGWLAKELGNGEPELDGL